MNQLKNNLNASTQSTQSTMCSPLRFIPNVSHLPIPDNHSELALPPGLSWHHVTIKLKRDPIATQALHQAGCIWEGKQKRWKVD